MNTVKVWRPDSSCDVREYSHRFGTAQILSPIVLDVLQVIAPGRDSLRRTRPKLARTARLIL